MSLLETVIAGLTVVVITAVSTWIWRQLFRQEIGIMIATEQGPTSRELGFTEPAVKITLMNKSGKEIRIKDIRLMFLWRLRSVRSARSTCGPFPSWVTRQPSLRRGRDLVHPR